MNKLFRLSLLKLCLVSAFSSQASVFILDTEQGNFSIGADIELNFNYQNRESQETDTTDFDEFNQDGRVLVEFAGTHYAGEHYVSFKAQPLMQTSGGVGLDDAYFQFGKTNGWAVKTGRFEAFDMFPLGMDVFIDYTGDTANDLYYDGAVYSYQMKEGRGRGADGQIMYMQNFGNIYVEVGAMIGDRKNLFAEGYYHGQQIEQSKDTVILRPVIAYTFDKLTLAASIERNLVKNSLTLADGTDISDRTGYGVTAKWAGDELIANASVAYLDAVDETDLSFGLNMEWHNIGLGYIYNKNDYENQVIYQNINNSWAEGDINLSTIYAAYRFDDVIDIDNFQILLGAHYSFVNNNLDQSVSDPGNDMDEDGDLGLRVRFDYVF